MQNNNEHINLIIKHLAGETAENEEQNLQNWLSEDENNRRIYDDYKKIWFLSQKEHVPEIENINVDIEWQKFKQKVNFDNEKHSVKPEKKTFSFIRIAASILILISVGIAGMYIFNKNEQKIVAFNEVKEAKLPDNTEISINKNSEIIYDKNFNKKERKVELKGEAFFKVSKNKEKPFIVKAESFYVEVLGTQFYVNSDFKNRQVVVKEGTVAVYQYKDKHDKIILQAGDKAVFNKAGNKILKIENTDKNYIAWKTKIFDFQNQNLEEISDVLENSYDIRFEFINPALKKCRQTVSFKNQNIDEIINVLDATFDNIKFRKNGKTVYVDGENCN